MMAMVDLLKAFVFIAIVLTLGILLGLKLAKRKPLTMRQIGNLRSTIESSFAPQFVAQFRPEDFQNLVEERLRTYLKFGRPHDPTQQVILAQSLAQGVDPIGQRYSAND